MLQHKLRLSNPLRPVRAVRSFRLAGACQPSRSVYKASAQPPTAPPWTRKEWSWQGHRVNYVEAGEGQPVVLVHGFGASVGQWRRTIPEISKHNKVYALDLLGFGDSDKAVLDYSIELWRDQLADFVAEVVGEPAALVGNSIGSLVSLAAAHKEADAITGVACLNCAGGMNNKARTDDWRVKLAYPIFLLIDVVLKTEILAARLFTNFRTAENVRSVLQTVYVNSDAVDDELVDLICKPGDDPNALAVFVSVLTGPPGPKPEELLTDMQQPVLILWGDRDRLTPLDGPVGRYCQNLPNERSNTVFAKLENTGHCPHDDSPAAVHEHLVPWLSYVTGVKKALADGEAC